MYIQSDIKRCLSIAFIIAVIAIAIVPSISFAQGTGAAFSASSAGEMKTAFATMGKAITAYNPDLLGIGFKLFEGLFFITFVWKLGEIIFEGGQFVDTLSGVIRTVFLGALTYWFLTPVSIGSGALAVASAPLPAFVDSLTSDITTKLLTLNGGDSSIEGVMGTAFQNTFRMLGLIADFISKIFKDAESASWISGGMAMLEAFFQYLPAIIYLTAASLIILLAGGIMFVMSTAGLFMFQIAAVLGPVFIPWLVLGATSWIFDGWLKFLIVAALYKVVGAAIISIGNGVFTSVLGTMMTTNASLSWGEVTTLAMLMAAVSAVVAYISLQIPQIAQGLMSGGGALSMGKIMSSLGSRGAQGAGMAASAAGKATNALVSTPQAIMASASSVKANYAAGGALQVAKGGAKAALHGAGSAAKGLGNMALGAGNALERKGMKLDANNTGSAIERKALEHRLRDSGGAPQTPKAPPSKP